MEQIGEVDDGMYAFLYEEQSRRRASIPAPRVLEIPQALRYLSRCFASREVNTSN